ncbi:hypothetical protein AAG570_004508 [Ranatra chinensis]|uniref:Protein RFT1 homolog n=1 Tax=Ranatra chinensis TaxID=642074 RepID=A0ABD0Y128_9HEMI
MGKNFLKSSLQNASFNIIYQIGFRIITFLLNAYVLRNISQAVVGVMNVRLLLLESTILFLSREAFRRACLTKTTEHNWTQVINLLWLTVPLCAVLSVLFGWIWLNILSTPEPEITVHYKVGVLAICISCVIEMCAEPLYLVSQAFLFVKLRILLDAINVTIRTLTFTILIVWKPSAAVVAFSAAQILAVVSYVVGYYTYFHFYTEMRKSRPPESPDDFPFRKLADFLPRLNSDGQALVDWKLCLLTWSFLKQGVLKQVLTEGERYVMTLFSVLTFAEQGVYDVVNNLGSLAARFLFRPIEESGYFYFSQLVHRDLPIKKQNEVQMTEAATVLRQLLRFVVSVGVAVVCFGQAYSRLLLALYGGTGLAEGVGPMLLRTHCLAILLLALNGTTECYALATMNTAQLDRYNHVMAFLSIGFLFFSWLLTLLFGSVGFILANCCNMAARISHSVIFIHKRYLDTAYKPLKGIIPGKLFLMVVISSAIITMYSEVRFYERSKITHFCIGAVSFFLSVGVWIYEEFDIVKSIYAKVRKHPTKEQ